VRLSIPRDQLIEFCRRWKISELSLFGSALREDFRPESDVDLLVSFAPGVSWGFDDYLTMKEEVEALFGRAVDLEEGSGADGQSRFFHIITVCRCQCLESALTRLVTKECSPKLPAQKKSAFPIFLFCSA